MTEGRTWVGIGEALLSSGPGGETVAGLAATWPMMAVRLGVPAVTVARVGQDANGERIARTLREHGVDASAMQYDPDLATGRLTIRSLAGRITSMLDARAAFDNLQWDFDMEDVAQQADVVMFGDLARREAQTRTTIDRFLTCCPHALRVYDLTNRATDAIDRAGAVRAASFAQGVVMDEIAVRALSPGERDKPLDLAASSLLRPLGVLFIVLFDGASMRVVSESGVSGTDEAIAPATREAALAGLIRGVLDGRDWPRSLVVAGRVAHRVASSSGERIPDDLLRA